MSSQEKNKLFENEVLITESGDKSVSLTSHRVRYTTGNMGKSHYTSIHLQDISSIEVHYQSRMIILLLGIIMGIAAIFAGAMSIGEVFIASIVLCVIFIIIFFATRKHVVTISSKGGAKINFFTKGMKSESVFDFIDKIETAKNKRF